MHIAQKSTEAYPIDFVVPWVDGDDPQWQELRNQYLAKEPQAEAVRTTDAQPSRYRDWGTLRYLLRGIDQFAPWARTVHLITQGHLPAWLNTSSPRLNIVRHEDYMPPEYLPTFAANAIELNLHRIDALSEHFVYCNDDMLITNTVTPGDFFRKGLPRLVASLEPATVARHSWFFMRVTNASIVNSHFSKHHTLRSHPLRWFNPRYALESIRTLATVPFGDFSGFRERHLPDPYLKSTFDKLWEIEGDILHDASRHRFRCNTDPNIWLIQDWQLASNQFMPGNSRIGKVFFIFNDEDARSAAHYITQQKGKLTCLNDHVDERDEDMVRRCANTVLTALNTILPNPSSFELPTA